MKSALAIVVVAHLLVGLPLVCAGQTNQAADAKIVAEATKGTLKSLKGTKWRQRCEAPCPHNL